KTRYAVFEIDDLFFADLEFSEIPGLQYHYDSSMHILSDVSIKPVRYIPHTDRRVLRHADPYPGRRKTDPDVRRRIRGLHSIRRPRHVSCDVFDTAGHRYLRSCLRYAIDNEFLFRECISLDDSR